MGNSTAPNRVPLKTTEEQNFLKRSRRPPLYDSPEEMTQLVPLPIKVPEVAGGRLQDVSVAFNNASDVNFPEKKDVKIEEVWSDHQQGTGGNMQTFGGYIEKVKEDKDKAPCASHHEYFQDRPKQSNNQSSLLKMTNHKGLIPSSKFHYVRRRTSLSHKIEHKDIDASLYLPKENDLEPKVDVAANTRTYLAIPISMETAETGTIPLVSQHLERTTTRSEPFPISQVERKLGCLI